MFLKNSTTNRRVRDVRRGFVGETGLWANDCVGIGEGWGDGCSYVQIWRHQNQQDVETSRAGPEGSRTCSSDVQGL